MPAGDPFDTPGFDINTDVLHSATLGVGSAMPGFRTVDGKGTAKQKLDLAARDAIPGEGLARDAATQIRVEGMRCFVQSNQREYQLQGGIDNAFWVDVTSPTSVGAKTKTTDEANILAGHILCQSPATANTVRLANPAADDALSRPVGVAVTAQAVSGLTLTAQTVEGEPVNALLVGALAPALGERIILSTTPGSGTIPGGAGAPAAGQVVQPVGILLDLLSYDGGANLTVLVQLGFAGTRRLES